MSRAGADAGSVASAGDWAVGVGRLVGGRLVGEEGGVDCTTIGLGVDIGPHAIVSKTKMPAIKA